MRLSARLVSYFGLFSCTAALPRSRQDASRALSLQMAQSIMAREQGMLSSGQDSSGLLQAGFVQKVLHALVTQYPQHRLKAAIDTHVLRSLDSVVPVLSDATNDTAYPLDRLSNGNGLLRAWKETNKEKYHTATTALRHSVDLQPKTAEGGLWYYVYPYWSYLDGMYSLAPFMAAYGQAVDGAGKPDFQSAIVQQLDLLWRHCYDDKTGLLVHGYDARRAAVWANSMSGASRHVWGRSLGWFCMALVDLVELLPASAREARAYVEGKLQLLVPAVVRAVDGQTGGWWQVMDQPGRRGNYIESSASSMFVYALLKSVRLGVLGRGGDAEVYERVARRAYEYAADRFVVRNGNGTLGWNGTVSVCSLNSTAAYEYYVGRPILYNSVLGSGAFVLASLEYERLDPR